MPVAWIARNLATDDTALGVRYSSARGLLPNTFDTLATISTRIINEVRGVNRVVYDISGKPPATIEWE